MTPARSIIRETIRGMLLAFRVLRRDWLGSLVVVVALTAAMGPLILNGSIYVELLKDDAWARQEDLVRIASKSLLTNDLQAVLYEDYQFVRDMGLPVDALSAYIAQARSDVETNAGLVTAVPTDYVSPELFQTLHMPLLLGRMFDDREILAGNPDVVVLDYTLWQTLFSGNPTVLGQQIRINGNLATIIGVGPPIRSWVTGGNPAGLYLPLSAAVAPSKRSELQLQVLARLKPGVSSDRVEQQLGRTDVSESGRRLVVTAAADSSARGPSSHRVELLLFATSLAAMLIGCVGVATIRVIRRLNQVREMTVKVALGASVTQVVLEDVWAGGLLLALGLAGALWLNRIALVVLDRSMGSSLTFDAVIAHANRFPSVNPAVLVAVIGAGAVGAIGIPGWHARRLLKSNSLGLASSPSIQIRTRAINAVLCTQVALSTAVLIVGSLLTRSIINQMRVPLGFETNGRLEARVVSPPDRDVSGLVPALQERFARDSLITVSGGRFMPLDESRSRTVVEVVSSGSRRVPSSSIPVWPGYFDTLGIGLTAGRPLDLSDSYAGNCGVVVNKAFQAIAWNAANGVSEMLYVRLRDGRTLCRVVGVAQDVRNLPDVANPTIYVPQMLSGPGELKLVLRTQLNIETAAARLSRAISELDPSLRVDQLRTLDDKLASRLRSERRLATAIEIAGLVSIILAIVTLSSLLGYALVSRHFEYAIRSALGATSARLVWTAFGNVIVVSILGLGTGLAVSVWVGRLLRTHLYGVGTVDAPTYVLVSSFVLLSLAVAFVPMTRQLLRTQPAVTLRRGLG